LAGTPEVRTDTSKVGAVGRRERARARALHNNISLKNTYCIYKKQQQQLVILLELLLYILLLRTKRRKRSRSYSEVTGRPTRYSIAAAEEACGMNERTHFDKNREERERERGERERERGRLNEGERGGPSNKYTSFYCSCYSSSSEERTSQSL